MEEPPPQDPAAVEPAEPPVVEVVEEPPAPQVAGEPMVDPAEPEGTQPFAEETAEPGAIDGPGEQFIDTETFESLVEEPSEPGEPPQPAQTGPADTLSEEGGETAEPEQPPEEAGEMAETTETEQPAEAEEPAELVEEQAEPEEEPEEEPSDLDSLGETVEETEGEAGELGELDSMSEQVEGAGEGESQDEEEGEDWTVKNVQTARVPPPVPVKPVRITPSGKPLDGVILTLGETTRLGKALRPDQLESEETPCVQKKHGTIVFCVEAVDWPDEMEGHFMVNSIMYQGSKAIVRYDEGWATNFHALFVSESYDAIIAYYLKRFGEPTENWTRRIAPLAAPRKLNPTVVWRSIEPVTNLTTHLEVRKYDDTRGGFPDTKRGAILLRHTYSTPIFPQLSTLELMLAK